VYEIVCKTSDALTLTRSVTESMIDMVRKREEERKEGEEVQK